VGDTKKRKAQKRARVGELAENKAKADFKKSRSDGPTFKDTDTQSVAKRKAVRKLGEKKRLSREKTKARAKKYGYE
jgi:hypothetical protein